MWPLSNIHPSKIFERQFFKPSFGFFLCTFSCFIVHLKQMCTRYCLIHTFVLLECCPHQSNVSSTRQGWSCLDHCLEMTERGINWKQARWIANKGDNLKFTFSCVNTIFVFLLVTWKITWSSMELCVDYNLSSHVVVSLMSQTKSRSLWKSVR